MAAPSGAVIRIATSSGHDPRALANAIAPDTLRRTRYAVIEEEDGEGRTLWKHPAYRPSA